MHLISGVRDPAAGFPLHTSADDAGERRQANRAVAVSALVLLLTGLVELAIAVLSGSVALLGDALHNLSDVSTSALVFVGFRASRKSPSDRYPYGYERAEDLAGLGVALVIWASAVVAGAESVTKLLRHGGTAHLGWGVAAAAVGIGWRLLVQAEVARAALTSSTPDRRPFYQGKIATAAFFASKMLPLLTAQRRIIESLDGDVMRLAEAAF